LAPNELLALAPMSKLAATKDTISGYGG